MPEDRIFDTLHDIKVEMASLLLECGIARMMNGVWILK